MMDALKRLGAALIIGTILLGVFWILAVAIVLLFLWPQVALIRGLVFGYPLSAGDVVLGVAPWVVFALVIGIGVLAEEKKK